MIPIEGVIPRSRNTYLVAYSVFRSYFSIYFLYLTDCNFKYYFQVKFKAGGLSTWPKCSHERTLNVKRESDKYSINLIYNVSPQLNSLSFWVSGFLKVAPYNHDALCYRILFVKSHFSLSFIQILLILKIKLIVCSGSEPWIEVEPSVEDQAFLAEQVD